MENNTVSFLRFYKPFIIAAPIVFILLSIVYVMANIYFYMLVSDRKMDVNIANFYIDCFRNAPWIVSALLLILGAFIALKNKEKHLRMIEEVHRAEENKPSVFSKI